MSSEVIILHNLMTKAITIFSCAKRPPQNSNYMVEDRFANDIVLGSSCQRMPPEGSEGRRALCEFDSGVGGGSRNELVRRADRIDVDDVPARSYAHLLVGENAGVGLLAAEQQ